MRTTFAYSPISLPNGTSVELALPAESSDPVVQAYRAGRPINQYLIDALLRYAPSAGRVLDLGCHVGTLSVPAAALGHEVIAVDAAPVHVEAVRLSAQRNSLNKLQVFWHAIAESRGPIPFHVNGLWGMVAREPGANADCIDVPGIPVHELMRAAQWDHVDLVKIDIEGSELVAIKGLESFLRGSSPPVIIYESNGMTFEMFGYTIQAVRRHLESRGYMTCRIEGASLVYCPPCQLQPEAWLDVVAIPAARQREFGVKDDWGDEALVRRCLDWGRNEHRNVREYLFKSFGGDVAYPREDLRIRELRIELNREFGAS